MRGFEDTPLDWAPASARLDEYGIMRQTIRFLVPGAPRPKGNVIKGRWGGYHDATKGLDDWLNTVAAQAQCAMNGQWRRREAKPWTRTAPHRLEMFDGPVLLGATFVMPSPKTHTPPVWLRDNRALWKLMCHSGAPMLKKPDVDKLTRAVFDAMTGIVWHDDSQVVETNVRKRYADPGEVCGTMVIVTTSKWDGGW